MDWMVEATDLKDAAEDRAAKSGRFLGPPGLKGPGELGDEFEFFLSTVRSRLI